MLTIPQIEALKKFKLYESMKRVASGVNNLKLSMDTGVADGTDLARVSTNALTSTTSTPPSPAC